VLGTIPLLSLSRLPIGVQREGPLFRSIPGHLRFRSLVSHSAYARVTDTADVFIPIFRSPSSSSRTIKTLYRSSKLVEVRFIFRPSCFEKLSADSFVVYSVTRWLLAEQQKISDKLVPLQSNVRYMETMQAFHSKIDEGDEEDRECVVSPLLLCLSLCPAILCSKSLRN
jgi:hypothetical protein